MNIVKIEQFKDFLKTGKTQATGEFNGHAVSFFFEMKKTGFGYRHYFICPNCGRLCTQLMVNSKIFTCFKCAGVNPYHGIQKTTRGGDEYIAYKMQRYAHKHGVAGFHFPFDYRNYERPKRHRREQWNTAMQILQALESMRNQAIFFGKIWDAVTIRSVENGTNDYLQFPALLHRMYWYPFDGKPQVNPFPFQSRETLTE